VINLHHISVQPLAAILQVQCLGIVHFIEGRQCIAPVISEGVKWSQSSSDLTLGNNAIEFVAPSFKVDLDRSAGFGVALYKHILINRIIEFTIK
jgi:hypothetical protein